VAFGTTPRRVVTCPVIVANRALADCIGHAQTSNDCDWRKASSQA
jgi:hypothetical protein